MLTAVFLPVLVFQVPWVQNKAAQELTAFLSKEWGTAVSVSKVQLGIFNQVKLEKFYLEDLWGDTLLYAGNLEIHHSGVFNLLFRRFRVESLRLENANIQIKRLAGHPEQNFQFIVDYFSRSDKKRAEPPVKPFQLDLRHLYFDNVHLVKPDEVKGEVFDVFVQHAEGHFSRFDLAGKRLDLSSFNLNSPDVHITLSPGNPLPKPYPPVKLAVERIPDTSKFVISIEDFDLGEGRFSLRNFRTQPERTTPPNILNYNYLDVLDLEIHLNNFRYSELEFDGEVEKISLRDTTGFVLENLSAKQASLSCRGMELYGLNLKTPYTELGDTLVLRYGGSYTAWNDFVNEVKMDVHLHNSHIALRDVMKFAPALEKNAFFSENKDQVVEIEGLVKGPVNRLDGKKLKISMARGLQIEGSFSTVNLTVPDEQFLHLNLERLHTDAWTLQKLLPGFRPPDNYFRLGQLDFSGKFDGFFVDFVADGKLKTDIGRAEMFMNLKLREGKEKARYSGDLYLDDFDLGAWTGNRDWGKITLDSHVKQGLGLTLKSVSAKLDGTVDSLVFKGYKYRNAKINGDLKRNLFNGDFQIQDGNIDLTFGGEINFSDTLPAFNFVANVKKLDLRPLNLTSKDLQFSGKVDMSLQGKRLSDITGTAKAIDLQIVKNRKDTLAVDTALLSSVWLASERKKVFNLQSTLGNVGVEGNFNIEKIPAQLTQFVARNYPKFAERLKIKPAETLPDTARFTFKAEVFQLQNLVNFFEESLGGFDQSTVQGSFDGFKNQLYLEVEVPSWNYQDIAFKDVYLRSKFNGPEGSLQVGVIETAFSETQKLSPVSLIGSVYTDTLEFLIISSNFYKILDNININGVLSLQGEDAWRVSFRPSDLVVLNETWEINTDNYLAIGKGKVETDNFILTSGERRIRLNSVRNEGLELQLENYPIDSLDFIKNMARQKLAGVADLKVKVKDVFRFEGLSALLRIDSLKVNGDNYGVLRLDASAPSIKETVEAYLSIANDTSSLSASGYFNPPGYQAGPNRKWVKNEPMYFDFDVDIEKYPTRIVQYFVADIKNVKGSVSAAAVRLYGLPSKPEIEGKATVNHASFTINALQTTYRVPQGNVTISNRIFDATDTWVYDRDNHKARLDGGITHNHLKNFGLDLRISTELNRPFLGLETTEKNNPIFYGTAIGTGYVRFTGSFAQPELYVNARTTAGTHMFMPMTSRTSTKEVNFITFTAPTLETEVGGSTGPQVKVLRGLNMEYDIEITPDAKMEVIFDKAWGDLLQGTGSGRLKVIMTREGQFDIYGDYTVATGNYLVTLMNIGLNKPFIVEPGGTISWSGDPYSAIIDINATYYGLSTSVYSFIQEYLAAASSEAQDLARNSTPVNLTMKMTGKLLQPDIAFDITFPSLDSELRNYAENKMRTVRLDPNELNRQVFGLLVLGQFLPSGYTIQAGELGINTVSEMLSNQLSIYLTDFVSEFFTGSNLIQGIDFDISYNRYSTGTFDPTDPAAAYTSSELRGRLKVIVNDRISIQGGVSGVVGSSNQVYTGNNGQLSGDFQIEYVISKDRRLTIKAYNSTEADLAGGRRIKRGAGLSYRKEFDSFQELVNSRKKQAKRAERKLGIGN
ncbi:MAG: translocation/assembly module TamB domain-containing protein [Bacteroidetes bacterium]|nr:translocation/assembly module TamB domain-containing protein [Bacteroidota bacterium]